LRWQAKEKPAFKQLNGSNLIRCPIPGGPSTVPHRVSLIIQAVLGGLDLPSTAANSRDASNQLQADQSVIFSCTTRLLKCLIDFAGIRDDAVFMRNALMLYRSISAQGWDDGPMQLIQIGGIGIASVRKLALAGIGSINALEHAEPHRIENALHKSPPFGLKLQAELKGFPKLRISLFSRGMVSFTLNVVQRS
jgi:ATP-dependent DNA helicase HFM1/MER3